MAKRICACPVWGHYPASALIASCLVGPQARTRLGFTTRGNTEAARQPPFVPEKCRRHFDYVDAALAAEQKLGDLASLTAKDRTRLEAAADQKLENRRFERLSYGDQKPKTRLDRLCKEFEDLREEAWRIHDEQINRDNLERVGRVIGGEWNSGEEEFDTEDFEEEHPDVVEGDQRDYESDD
jgi:hypothetical protein